MQGLRPWHIYTAMVVALVVVAGVAFYLGGVLTTRPPNEPGGSANTTGGYNIASVFVSFVGSGATNFFASQVKCTGNSSCGFGFAGSEGLFLPITVNLSTKFSCSNLSQFQVDEVSADPSGAFVVTNISTNDNAPQPSPGFLPLPAFVPWGNSTVCFGYVQLFVTLSIVAQGPHDQTLFLQVSANSAPH